MVTQEDFDWWIPDLAGLDFVHYHERLRAQTTHLHWTEQWVGPEGAGIDPALRPAPWVGDGLGVLSRLPFTGETRRSWHDCFGGADTSDGGAADCLAGKGFGVVTMALSTLREDDYDQLAAFVQEHSAGRAVILAGDTNLHTDAGHPQHVAVWERFLARTGLVDACTALGCDEPGSIDKVAYRDRGGVGLAPTALDFPRERFRDPAGDDLSDHPPLTVDFHWRATT